MGSLVAANHYAVLGLRRGASPDRIEAAYRSLIEKYDPLRNTDPQASQWLGKVKTAFMVLGDPVRKYYYDQSLSSDPSLGSPGDMNCHLPTQENGRQCGCEDCHKWVQRQHTEWLRHQPWWKDMHHELFCLRQSKEALKVERDSLREKVNRLEQEVAGLKASYASAKTPRASNKASAMMSKNNVQCLKENTKPSHGLKRKNHPLPPATTSLPMQKVRRTHKGIVNRTLLRDFYNTSSGEIV